MSRRRETVVKLRRVGAAFLAGMAVFSSGVFAAIPEAGSDASEKRLVAIASELRCLVCQNESLAGSQADLANDLRREIRGLIAAGKSDAEIMAFMVDRYGDFVRYRPPLKGATLLLWFGPGLLLVVGLGGLIAHLRRRAAVLPEPEITRDENERALELLGREGDDA